MNITIDTLECITHKSDLEDYVELAQFIGSKINTEYDDTSKKIKIRTSNGMCFWFKVKQITIKNNIDSSNESIWEVITVDDEEIIFNSIDINGEVNNNIECEVLTFSHDVTFDEVRTFIDERFDNLDRLINIIKYPEEPNSFICVWKTK